MFAVYKSIPKSDFSPGRPSALATPFLIGSASCFLSIVTIWHSAIGCGCFSNRRPYDTAHITSTTRNDSLSTPWPSVVALGSSLGGCCLRAGLSAPTRLQMDSDSLGETCTPLSPLPDLQASSFAQGLLFVPQRLSGPLRPCPSSGLLLPVQMNGSDFRPGEAPGLLALELFTRCELSSSSPPSLTLAL